MFKKYKPIWILLIAVIVIGGAGIAYPALSDYYSRIASSEASDGASGNASSRSSGDSAEGTSVTSRLSDSASLSASSPSDSSGSGNPAPDFTVYRADGTAVKLSDYRGKPVVLNFWASWCPPCRNEMPVLDSVYKDLKDEVAFVMVDLTDGSYETVQTGKEFIEEQGYSFPVFFDTKNNASAAFGISSIPATYFIDSDGNIAGNHIGSMDEQTLRSGIALIYGGP